MTLADRIAERARETRPPFPLAELHCHLEGAVPRALARRLAAREGRDIAGLVAPDGERYAWQDFAGFLAAYDRVAALLTRPEDYEGLARDHLEGLASAGALYAELFVSPDHARAAGLDPAAYVLAAGRGAAAAERACGIVCRLVVVGVRHFGAGPVEAAARFARDPAFAGLVTGFGLAGDERTGRPRDFARAFDTAREAGLGLTAHAGEFAGPAAVAETLDALKVARLGHGVRAVEDEALVARIVRDGIVLEVCAGSNLALGLYPDPAAHPLRAFSEAGARIALGSDDPPFFATDLRREYDLAAGMGLSESVRAGFTRTAIEAAFLDGATRARLLKHLSARLISLGAPAATD